MPANWDLDQSGSRVNTVLCPVFFGDDGPGAREMPSEINTVCVVDDDPAIRDSMLEMLGAAGLPAETYPSGDAFLDTFDPSRVGCAVFDVCMPGIDGLDLCEQIRREHPYIPIIIVTGHGDVIEKPFSNRQLLALIRESLGKGSIQRQQSNDRSVTLVRLELLTAREKEVVELILEGLLNKQMAARLQLSERTIEFHRKNIMEKMQAGSVPKLVEMILVCRSGD
jgi:FixJ family two-component response regulator